MEGGSDEIIILFLQNFPKLNTSVPNRGDLVLAMGSPFGILSPVHFFNKYNSFFPFIPQMFEFLLLVSLSMCLHILMPRNECFEYVHGDLT